MGWKAACIRSAIFGPRLLDNVELWGERSQSIFNGKVTVFYFVCTAHKRLINREIFMAGKMERKSAAAAVLVDTAQCTRSRMQLTRKRSRLLIKIHCCEL